MLLLLSTDIITHTLQRDIQKERERERGWLCYIINEPLPQAAHLFLWKWNPEWKNPATDLSFWPGGTSPQLWQRLLHQRYLTEAVEEEGFVNALWKALSHPLAFHHPGECLVPFATKLINFRLFFRHQHKFTDVCILIFTETRLEENRSNGEMAVERFGALRHTNPADHDHQRVMPSTP